MMPAAGAAPSPKDALKKISSELKAKFDDAGMDKVEAFMDKIEDLQEKVKTDPSTIMDQLKKMMSDLQGVLKKAAEDPGSLAPSNKGFAACASWYGKSVAGNLKKTADEVAKLTDSMTDLAKNMKTPIAEVSKTLGNVLKELENSLSKLARLPKQILKLGETVDSPDDMAKIDTAPMHKCLDISGIDKPLGNLVTLKDLVGKAIDAVKAGIRTLADFVMKAPDTILHAFDVPTPLCFLTQQIQNQLPQAGKDMLAMVESMKKIDLQPAVALMESIADTLAAVDVAKIKAPVTKFAEGAKANVDDLDEQIKAAKLLQGGAGGKLGSLF